MSIEERRKEYPSILQRIGEMLATQKHILDRLDKINGKVNLHDKALWILPGIVIGVPMGAWVWNNILSKL